MNRFCDNIQINRLVGDRYNPFGDTGGLVEEEVFNGECKAKHNYPNGVDGECYYDIFINDNEVMAHARDIAYLYNNGNEEDCIKLIVLEVKRYERNTVIKALHLKDGEGEEL